MSEGNDGKVEALFSQIHPQLCAGLFSLLEEVIELSGDSAGGPGGSYWAGRNAPLVVEVVDGLCGVLCSLIDSSHPCQCPTSTLHSCCERAVSILSTAPHGSHVAQVIAVATAIVRQSSDCSGAPTEDLHRLPFLCLRRSLQILHQSSLYLQDRNTDGDGGGDDCQEGSDSCDLLIVLESLRLVRQCCVAHPEVLSETGRFNLDPLPEGAGNLFFECFSCLVKSPRVLRNGALVRMMNTALSCFNDEGGRYRGRKAGAARTVLTRTNYLPSFMLHLGSLLCTLLSLGLFEEQDRALRTFSGYIENLLNLYRTNRGSTAISNGIDGNFSGMLEHVCGQISLQIDAVSSMSSSNTFNTVLCIPSIGANIVMVSASQYLRVVYLTLIACIQDSKQATSTRQSYMELCQLYRAGRVTAQALQVADASADVERRGEILRSVPESVCKLVIWPLGEF